ncbi:tumor necrosis factor receptor superfamily member 14-like [Latimeria chalumnae]|uniref:tumor necrosis factor receptor superfamily member 14-like n=1 Tax=Latimeria chalumnae TaxID=7897 RepID=UPI00313EAC6F
MLMSTQLAGTYVSHHCSETKSTDCDKCPSGTYAAEPNKKTECFPCLVCKEDLGMYSVEDCNNTKDTVCDCLEGHHCNKITPEGCRDCQRHKTCPPGEYVKRPGTYRFDILCLLCPNGTYSDTEDSKTCKPWTNCTAHSYLKSNPGTFTSDTQCKLHWAIVLLILLLISFIIWVVWRKKTGMSLLPGFRRRTDPQRCGQELQPINETFSRTETTTCFPTQESGKELLPYVCDYGPSNIYEAGKEASLIAEGGTGVRKSSTVKPLHLS